MDLSPVADRGLVLLGCGKMGTALLEGWLAGGGGQQVPPEMVSPGSHPRQRLYGRGAWLR